VVGTWLRRRELEASGEAAGPSRDSAPARLCARCSTRGRALCGEGRGMDRTPRGRLQLSEDTASRRPGCTCYRFLVKKGVGYWVPT